MRKTMLVALASVFGICVLIVAANASTIWQGPPSNCTSPEGSTCNTDGVVWNRTTPAQDGSFNLKGSGILGTGLTIQTGDLNANSLIFLKQNGDLWLSDGKSLVVNKNGSQSQLYIGNFGLTPSNIKVTIFGDLETSSETPDEGYTTKISTPTLCLNGDCKSEWPTSGASGTVTGATTNGGLVLTDTTLGLSTSCANGQVLKWNGAAWACAGAGVGTVTSVDSGSGLTGGPITGSGTLSIDPAYTGLTGYLKKTGDSGTGIFNFSGDIAGYGSSFYAENTNTSGGIAGGFSGKMMGVSGRSTQTDPAFVSYGVRGVTESNTGSGVMGDGTGLSGGVRGTGVTGKGNPGISGRTANSSEYGVAGNFIANRFGVGLRAAGQYGLMVSSTDWGFGSITGPAIWAESSNNDTTILANKNIVTKTGKFCFDTNCISSWPTSGVTGATVGGGLTLNGSGLGLTGINTASCAADQVLKWNGTQWACSPTGDISGVTAGNGLTTGGTSGDVTVNVGAGTGIQANADDISILTSYRLPQTCTHGQVATRNAQIVAGVPQNFWECNTPQNLITDNWVNSSGDSMTGDLNITANKINFGTQSRQMLDLWSTSHGIGVQNNTTYERTAGGFAWFKGGVHSNTQWDPGTGGKRLMYMDVEGQLHLPASVNSGGAWPGYYFQNRTSGSEWTLLSDNVGGLAANVNSAAFYLGSNRKMAIDDTGSLRIEGANAWKSAGTSWTAWSDMRLKDKVANYDKGLKAILGIQPIKYRFKKDNPKGFDSNKEYIGLSAQEVKKTIPEAITQDEQGYYMLNADPIFWAEINAIKELKIQNDMLQAENDMLLHRIEALEAKMK